IEGSSPPGAEVYALRLRLDDATAGSDASDDDPAAAPFRGRRGRERRRRGRQGLSPGTRPVIGRHAREERTPDTQLMEGGDPQRAVAGRGVATGARAQLPVDAERLLPALYRARPRQRDAAGSPAVDVLADARVREHLRRALDRHDLQPL